MPRAAAKGDTYQKKLLKLLPSESVATYLAAINIIPQEDATPLLYIIIIAAITIITPFYLIRFMEMKLKDNLLQIILLSLSFIVWAFSLNGESWIIIIKDYSYVKSLVLILWTFMLPAFLEKESHARA